MNGICPHDSSILSPVEADWSNCDWECDFGHTYRPSETQMEVGTINLVEVYYRGEPRMLDFTRPFRDQVIELKSGVLIVDEDVSDWNIQIARAGHVFH